MAEDEFLEDIRKYKIATHAESVRERDEKGKGVINTCVINNHKESCNYGAHTGQLTSVA